VKCYQNSSVEEAKKTSDLYVLKSSYDIMLSMCESSQQHFVEF
jgi:hypothetical protein